MFMPLQYICAYTCGDFDRLFKHSNSAVKNAPKRITSGVSDFKIDSYTNRIALEIAYYNLKENSLSPTRINGTRTVSHDPLIKSRRGRGRCIGEDTLTGKLDGDGPTVRCFIIFYYHNFSVVCCWMAVRHLLLKPPPYFKRLFADRVLFLTFFH